MVIICISKEGKSFVESLSEWAANYEIKLNYRKTVSPAVKMFLVAYSCLHRSLFVNFPSLILKEWKIHAFWGSDGGPASEFMTRSFVNGSDRLLYKTIVQGSWENKSTDKNQQWTEIAAADLWRNPADFRVYDKKLVWHSKIDTIRKFWECGIVLMKEYRLNRGFNFFSVGLCGYFWKQQRLANKNMLNRKKNFRVWSRSKNRLAIDSRP